MTAEKLIPYVLEFIYPHSVVEIGCGEGELLKEFQKLGGKILGIDEENYAKEAFWQENKELFLPVELEKVRINCQSKFDLAVCLECAHKFMEDRAELLIRDLSLLSDVVLFSAAIPGQNENVINGQMPSYWARMFRRNGFIMLDCLRNKIWDDEEIDVRYRQNLLLYVREDKLVKYPKLLKFYMRHDASTICDIVHPKCFDVMIKNRMYDKKTKRILYTFYHHGAISWVLAHKLDKHPHDDAWLLIGNPNPNYDKYYEKYIENNIFRGLYRYNPSMGMNETSVELVEAAIKKEIDKCTKEQGFSFDLFDEIYSLTDYTDGMGIFFSLNNIPFYWAEWTAGTLLRQKGAGGEGRAKFDFASRPGYRDALLKHKTFMGENDVQSFILMSDKTCGGYPPEKCKFFNPLKVYPLLSSVDKLKLMKCYSINEDEVPCSSNIAWVFLLSDSCHNNRVWPIMKFIHGRFKNAAVLYFFTVQAIIDYYIPSGFEIALKTHPAFPITKSGCDRYLDGVYAFPQMFTLPQVQLLPNKYLPNYIVSTGGSVPKEMFWTPDSVVYCVYLWDLSFLIHKFFISLCVLDRFGVLYSNSGSKFGVIGRKDKSPYHMDPNCLHKDIDSLIKVNFPKINKMGDANYFVLQYAFSDIYQKMNDCEFVIYTDVWEDIIIQNLKEINNKYNMIIIRIVKTTIDKNEDIIAPMQNEYIFLFSKSRGYIESMIGFSAHKINKTMGVIIDASTISLGEYESEIEKINI